MDDDERDRQELRLEVERLKAEQSRTHWWNVTAGIASIVGAILGSITLVAILNRLSELTQQTPIVP